MDKALRPASQNSKTRSTGFGEIEEIEDEVGRQYNRFNNFELVSSSPCDHHYLMETQYLCTKLIHMHRFRKTMEEECRLLEKHIPSSIFVRTYEHRIDLMRAAFFGPPGSDYQHCLFFFDICFPLNYPRVPPNIHYLSYGLDWNPNLRPNGRVCLDLAETWYDHLKQFWPGSNKKQKRDFSVLQLLHAIQNLISCRSGPLEKHNAKAFARACEKITRILRKPPVGFEYFVAGHFRQRAHPVLLKFKEHDYEDEFMIDLFVRMFKVFQRNGAYCKHHLDFLKSRNRSLVDGDQY
ncbi:hypothetical protein SASPL_100003 [Salvia splendens]|uniref:UBC core domain-containing protein n=1 Tax=Salvia splendens TaxID=180675 RepID=A0A8X8YLK6_SALSN|nr:putative ubiquitin-conjugating enzyme E2 38 [Salvia splendens]KAG6435135.1 hypothetical protein SASPL_100003 [Salvia splendens]